VTCGSCLAGGLIPGSYLCFVSSAFGAEHEHDVQWHLQSQVVAHF
jgi:hypothetical protein